MNKIYLLVIVTTIFATFFTGCEDQEDTWDEFTGDGRIRYTGVCTDVNLKLGWEEVTLTWKIRWIPTGKTFWWNGLEGI